MRPRDGLPPVSGRSGRRSGGVTGPCLAGVDIRRRSDEVAALRCPTEGRRTAFVAFPMSLKDPHRFTGFATQCKAVFPVIF